MSDSLISVVVTGATGKMGREVVKMVLESSEFKLVGAVDRHHVGEKISNVLHLDAARLDSRDVVISSDLEAVLEESKPSVGVDFTNPESMMGHVRLMIKHGCRPVIGTSGFTPHDREELKKSLTEKQIGGMWVPNFAIGAVLMMMFAEKASQYFDHAEVIEYHHNKKLDAPSGTATHTLARMSEMRPQFNLSNIDDTETLVGARGGVTESGLRVHSVRLPGLIAHQEVLLSDSGQLLTVRHDSWNRSGFMPGVALAIKHVAQSVGLTVGLEAIL